MAEVSYTLTELADNVKKFLVSGQLRMKDKKSVKSIIEALMFFLAYPQSAEAERIAEKRLASVTRFLKSASKKQKMIFENTGMPFTNLKVQFTHDFLQWLQSHDGCKVILETSASEMPDLNSLLYTTLTSAERTETSAGLDNDDLFQTLGVKQDKQLSFLLNEFNRLNQVPLVKDFLFDSLALLCTLQPEDKKFSLAYNRFRQAPVYYHRDLLKKFDHEKLISAKIPLPLKLDAQTKMNLVDTIKKSMALTNRETDTVTYMDENSIRYIELERGIAVAVYGMTPERQLPFESYMGYTLFKNGYPCAYGGSWVFGRRALFGINIFDWFRGGESGYVFCQLLRVYRQCFGIDYFEVEPYQYGQDNPDGIKSGAFWFYYRYGFRPVDSTLRVLAAKEAERIRSDKNYRTSERTLIQFTESNIAWAIKPVSQIRLENITKKISHYIQKKYHGNRLKAEEESVIAFSNLVKKKIKNVTPSIVEAALWRSAYEITKQDQIDLLYQMSIAKPVDPYRYQQLLLKFLNAE